MKILLASAAYYPNTISGVGLVVKRIADFLAQNNNKVFVLTGKSNTKIEKSSSIEFIELPVIKNPLRKDFDLPVATPQKISEILGEIKPDIIHIHDPSEPNILLLEAARKRKIPTIITNHFVTEYALSYVPKLLHAPSRRIMERRLAKLYNKASIIITPTKTIKLWLESIKVSIPIEVISNGVDTKIFKPTGETKNAMSVFKLPNKLIVLFVGRLNKDKSIPVLLKAVPKIIAKTSAHFVITGSGDQREKLKQFVDKNNLTKHITFTGSIDHDNPLLAELYRLASVFVIPSTIETQSIATLEAMACGKPIIAANAQALPELVKNTVNGFLFNPGDSDELAIQIIRILEDGNLQRSMGQKSVEYIKKHSLDSSLNEYQLLYNRIMKGMYENSR